MQRMLFAIIFFPLLLSFDLLFADSGKVVEVGPKVYQLWGAEMEGMGPASPEMPREVRCDGVFNEKFGVVSKILLQHADKGVTNVGVVCKDINFKVGEVSDALWSGGFFETDGRVEALNSAGAQNNELFAGVAVKKCSWGENLELPVGAVKTNLFTIANLSKEEAVPSVWRDSWEALGAMDCTSWEVRMCPDNAAMMGVKVYTKEVLDKKKKKGIQVKERQVVDMTPICQFWMPVETIVEKK